MLTTSETIQFNVANFQKAPELDLSMAITKGNVHFGKVGQVVEKHKRVADVGNFQEAQETGLPTVTKSKSNRINNKLIRFKF